MRLRFGDCLFDPDARELLRGARRVELSAKALDLLGLLVSNRPRPLSHEALRDRLWPDTHVGYTSLARLVSELRRALGDSPVGAASVRTLPRFGYAFVAPVVSETTAGSGGTCALVAHDREFTLPEGRTLVGRGEDCGVRLRASQVSRVHAVIEVGAGSVTLRDNDSKNGTWINGRRLTGMTAVEDGDELLFGTYRVVLRRSGPQDSTRTSPPARAD